MSTPFLKARTLSPTNVAYGIPDSSICLQQKPGSCFCSLEVDCSPALYPTVNQSIVLFLSQAILYLPTSLHFSLLSPSSGTPSCLYTCNSLLTHLPFLLTLCPTFTRQLWNMNESTALPVCNIRWLSRRSGQAAKSSPGPPLFPFLPLLCAPVTLAPHSS